MGPLQLLPLEYLPDTPIAQISQALEDVNRHLKAVDSFTIETGNPTQARDSLVGNIHSHADTFYTVATPWIPYLAYRKGEVAENIRALTTSVNDAKGIVEKAKVDVAAKGKEIDDIIVKAREASAGAGAAVFTKDFSKEADNLYKSAQKWLTVTGVMALLTLSVAGYMWFNSGESKLDGGQIIQKFGTKMVILGVLFTASLWCGKNFKALMHQSTMNKHRALSLQTFQAFSHATSDNQTKDAVLMETTKSIFGNTSSGFIDQNKGTQDGPLKIVEVIKSVGSSSNPES